MTEKPQLPCDRKGEALIGVKERHGEFSVDSPRFYAKGLRRRSVPAQDRQTLLGEYLRRPG